MIPATEILLCSILFNYFYLWLISLIYNNVSTIYKLIISFLCNILIGEVYIAAGE